MADDNFYFNIDQFDQFLLLIGQVLSDEKEIAKIQNKLRRHFHTTSTSYLSSKDFQVLIDHTRELFTKKDKSTKYFKLLRQLDEQLMKHRIKASKTHNSLNDIYDSETDTSSTNKISAINSSKASTSDNINECLEISETNQSKTTTDSADSSDMQTKQNRKIEKLERRLFNISKIISQLEQQEMSLDDMKYLDLYEVESKLKKQACEMYTKLANLKNQSPSIERILDQPISLADAEIDHPSINTALEKMVNQTKYLPSFDDVLETVEKTDDRCQLTLSIEAKKAIAEKAMKIIGIKVKTRRMADFNDIMSSRLPENFNIEQNDPALKNQELENILLKNERDAVIKTQQIFEDYSQMGRELESEMNDESSEESIDDSEDEHSGDEDDDIKSNSIDSLWENNTNEYQFDVVDVIPPFSPKFVTTEGENQLNDSVSDIVSTSSITIQRTTNDTLIPESQNLLDSDNHECQPILVIPRRQVRITSAQTTTESFFSIFEKQMNKNDTSPLLKRSLENETNSTTTKKLKPPPDILILD